MSNITARRLSLFSHAIHVTQNNYKTRLDAAHLEEERPLSLASVDVLIRLFTSHTENLALAYKVPCVFGTVAKTSGRHFISMHSRTD
jgi:hypothetical protein